MQQLLNNPIYTTNEEDGEQPVAGEEWDPEDEFNGKV